MKFRLLITAFVLFGCSQGWATDYVDPDYAFMIPRDSGKGQQRAWLVEDRGKTLVLENTIGKTVTVDVDDLSEKDKQHLAYLRLPEKKKKAIEKKRREKIAAERKRKEKQRAERKAARKEKERRKREAFEKAERARKKEAKERAARWAEVEAKAAEAALKKDLDASIRSTGNQLVIRNDNDYDWHSVKICVNPGWISDGYYVKAAKVEAGKTYTVGLMTFADKGGQRFNPFTQKLRQVKISGKKPDDSLAIGLYGVE